MTLEDIYDLNEQYRETPELDKEEAVEFLMKRAEKDGRNIEYEMDGEDADIIVVGCPMCYTRYDAWPEGKPVVYIMELVAMAFGDTRSLGYHRIPVSTR